MYSLLKYASFLFGFVICAIWLGTQPASAAPYPCNGPGPGRIMVGMTPAGNGVASVPLCVDDPNSSSPVAAPPAPVRNDFSAVAWHPDASDVWASARYQNQAAANDVALRHCNEVMGSGCEVIWQVNGFIGAAISPNGNIMWSANSSRGKVKKSLEDQCKEFVLGCVPIGIFKSTDGYETDGKWINIRKPQNMALLRKKYAAVAWVMGQGYDGTSFIATGYATYPEASSAALAECQKHYGPKLKCEIVVGTGNGFIQAFRSVEGDNFLIDQSVSRTQQALPMICKRQKLKNCVALKMYDARQPGLFAHRAQ